MMKKLRLIHSFLLLLLAIGMHATEPISGFFRIKNAHTRPDGKLYVQVTGKYQAQPNQTVDAVKTQPGSVIQIEAKWDNAKSRYTITTLRSQGVDVVNGYLLQGLKLVKENINQKIQDKLGNGFAANIAKTAWETRLM